MTALNGFSTLSPSPLLTPLVMVPSSRLGEGDSKGGLRFLYAPPLGAVLGASLQRYRKPSAPSLTVRGCRICVRRLPIVAALSAPRSATVHTGSGAGSRQNLVLSTRGAADRHTALTASSKTSRRWTHAARAGMPEPCPRRQPPRWASGGPEFSAYFRSTTRVIGSSAVPPGAAPAAPPRQNSGP